MDIVERAQDLLNLGVVMYAAIALMLVALLTLLCIGVAAIERRGTRREHRRTARRPASYGATRRHVLGAR